MKVLHIAKWDDSGGASICMLRLHRELLKKGIDSVILCERSRGNVERVELVGKGWRFQLGRILERLIGYLVNLQTDNSLFFNSVNVRPNNLLKRIHELKPDVVHLHWVGLGVLRIEDLPEIRQPVVWTLHDMWAFCGSEHCNLGDSERWKKAYSKSSRPVAASGLDITRWVWQRKRKAWSTVALTTVAPSEWMQQCASNSSLWKNNRSCNHRCIHNGLDTEVFKPVPQPLARATLNLKSNLPVLLFGAHSLSSYVKGGDLLHKALERALAKGLKFQLVTFGSGAPEVNIDVPTRHLGLVSDLSQLSRIYCTADVVLVPSRIESFGQVASEALACGAPVLCFDTSGLRDVVEHEVSGYRAECFSVEDFVDGLEWLLEVEDKDAMRRAAREHALDRFKIGKMADAYIDLYSSI